MTATDIFDAILTREGGYVDHPADKGGPTHWGVTEAVARAHGYQGEMRALTRDDALAIYRADYWYGPRYDQVAELSPAIAAELCDTGINMGPGVSTRWLQRWLTALNDGGRLYPDLQPDGNIGPRTLTALRQYLDARGADGHRVLLRALNCSQGARYLELAEQRAVVLGLLAVALGMQSWRLHHIQMVADRQSMTLTVQRAALDERDRQLRELNALAERNDKAQARLRALAADTQTALAARQKTIARLTRENEEVRRWADARLPADVVRLRQRPALAGGHAYRQWLSQADALPVSGGQPADQWRSE